jgi:predicted ATP-dependent protease
MLRQEVVDAVKNGKFHVYAVSTVDEGIEILTGMKAGVKKRDGTYPKNSINYKVDEKLKGMAARLRQFAAPPAEEKKAAGS